MKVLRVTVQSPQLGLSVRVQKPLEAASARFVDVVITRDARETDVAD